MVARIETVLDGCNETLAYSSSPDEFHLTRFIRLVQEDPANRYGPGIPAVLPLNVVHAPLYQYFLSKGLTGNASLGGVSLSATWAAFKPTPQAPMPTVDVSDPHNLIAQPTVGLPGGRKGTATLTGENIVQLLTGEPTIALVRIGRSQELVRFQPRLPPMGSGGQPPQTFAIPDVPSFLSKPIIVLANGVSVPITLTPDNVRDLVSLGTATISLTATGGQTVPVFLQAQQSMLGGNMPGGTRLPPNLRAPGDDPPDPPDPSDPPDPPDRGPIGKTGPVGGGTGTAGEGIPGPPPAAPAFHLVLYLPYKQTWALQGYSRGPLLNSFALAPQEEMSVEVFTWDRLTQTREQSLSTEQQMVDELTVSTKSTAQTMRQLTTDFGWKSQTGANITLPTDEVKAAVNSNMELSFKIGSVAKSTNEQIAEASSKTSRTIRSTRAIKVQQTEESGFERRLTRKLKNPNMCHVLNIDYYQVNETYSVTTELQLQQVRLCALVSTQVSGSIDRSFLLTHEGALRQSLLSPIYLSGFDAAHRLDAWDRLCSIACASTCVCDAAAAAADLKAAGDALQRAGASVSAAISLLENAKLTPLCSWARGQNIDYADAVGQAGMYLYRTVLSRLHPKMWHAAHTFAHATVSPDQAMQLLTTIHPDALDAIRLPMTIAGVAMDIWHEVAADPTCWLLVALIGTGAVEMPHYNDAGLPSALRELQPILDSYKRALLREQHAEDEKQAQQDDAVKQALGAFPPSDIATAVVSEQSLIRHILHNSTYYRRAIWQALDLSDRERVLGMAGNLREYLESDPVGFVGDRLALPIRLENAPQDVRDWFVANVAENEKLRDIAQAVQTEVLPTGATTVEQRLGECDGCEDFIQRSRATELQRLQAIADKEKSESDRFMQRVAGGNLDDPHPCCDGAIKVSVEPAPSPRADDHA